MTSRRIVAGLIAHPDDELFAAGLLAACARAGAHVIVVVATRGERGASHIALDAPLGQVRSAELARSCEILGAEPPRILGLPDGKLSDVSTPELAEIFARAVADVSIDTLVTLGRDGVYGHRDHLACAAAAESWAAATSTRLLETAFPPGLFATVSNKLRKAMPRIIDPDVDANALGTALARVDLRLDVAGVRDIKREAFAAHRSQLAGGEPGGLLGARIAEHMLAEEWYEVVRRRPIPPDGAGSTLLGADEAAALLCQ